MKIYNVKKVKTEMTCAPPKTYKIKNPFGFLQTNFQILAERVEPFFFHKKHVFMKHPNAYTEFTLTSGLKNSESGEGDA